MSEAAEIVALSTTEQQDLARCESIVARGMQTFIEVGNALAEIREQRLYRASHATFADYCQERWGMTGRNARRLIDASEVMFSLESGPIGPLPVNEAQARPLVPLPPEQRRKAWAKAVESSDGKPTARDVEQAVQEQRLPPLDAPGLVLLKALGWRLDARIPPDKYRVLPPSGPAEVLTDAECLERSRSIPLVRLPDDFQEMQKALGDIGYLAMDGRTGRFRVVFPDGDAVSYPDWDGMKAHIAALTAEEEEIEDAAVASAPVYAPPADFASVQTRLGDRGTLSLDTATGVFCVAAPGEESVTFQDSDFHLRWRLTKEHCARLRQRDAAPAYTPLPTPPVGWSLWQDNDETYGMAHDCGIKLRGTSPDRLVDEAREMSIWIERLKGWFVTLDIQGTGWQATHEAYGQVLADDLPTLALRAFWHAATARDLPDLPDYVISAAFLAGWTYKRTEGSYYIYTEGRFTLGELLYELNIPEPQAPAEPEPEPDATAQQREVLTAWLAEYLCILREPVQRMLAQTLVPASTQPWADATGAIRAAMAAKIVASLDETMLHQCMGREGVGR